MSENELKRIAVIGDKDSVTRAISHNVMASGYELTSRHQDADVAITYCLDEDNLTRVYFGDDGLVTSMKPGSFLIDCSPSIPSVAKEISAMAQVSNMHAIDAPLFVRDITSEHAFEDPDNLVALAGGVKEDFSTCKDVLFSFAAKTAYCGDAGAGQKTKAAFTLAQAQSLVTLIESQMLYRGDGDAKAVDAMVHRMVLSGLMPENAERMHEALRDHAFGGSYTVEIMAAEMHEAYAYAQDEHLVLPQAEAAQYLLRMISIIGGIDMNPVALGLIYTDEETCEKFGLDWDRAEEAARVLGNASDDDEDGERDDDEDGFDFGTQGDSFGGTIGGLSSN